MAATDNNTKNLIELCISGLRFTVSKTLLIHHSDYFKAMFSSNFIESKKNSIDLQDTDPDSLKKILDFIEIGSLSCIENITTCYSVLECAAMLQFSEVEKICEVFLLQEIRYDNALEIYQTCRLGHSQIAEAALTCALWEAKSVVEADSFLEQTIEGVIDFLSKPEINCNGNTEWMIWEAIMNWINKDESARKCYLLRLLQCIDYYSLTSDDISNMMFYDLICDNGQATTLLEKVKAVCNRRCQSVKQFPECMNSDESEIDVPSNVSKVVFGVRRRPAGMPWLATFGRVLSKDDCTTTVPVVVCYDSGSNSIEEIVQLTKICPKSEVCVGFRVCSVGPSLYITGGQYTIGGQEWNNDVWSYCPITRKWKVHSPLPKRRRNHMVCVLGSVIYLMGGFGRHRIALSSVDAYDTQSGKWLRRIPDMPFYQTGAICAFKNRVLVFVNTMLFTYFPEQRIWSKVDLSIVNANSFSYAVCYGDAVFLLGSFSKKIYRIYPDEENTVKLYSSFINDTQNICLSFPYIVSFCVDDINNTNVIERICIDVQKDETLKQDHSKAEVLEQDHSKAEVVEQDHSKAEVVEHDHSKAEVVEQDHSKAEVVWSSDINEHSSVSNILFSNSSASNGCATIFKLEKGRLS